MILQWTKNIGNLTSNDVLNAPTVHEDWFRRDNNMYGGRKMNGAGFFDDLWSGIKQVGSVVKNVAPAISSLSGLIPHPAAQAVSRGANVAGDVAKNLGFGHPHHNNLGGKRRGRPKGSTKKHHGGAALSSRDLL